MYKVQQMTFSKQTAFLSDMRMKGWRIIENRRAVAWDDLTLPGCVVVLDIEVFLLQKVPLFLNVIVSHNFHLWSQNRLKWAGVGDGSCHSFTECIAHIFAVSELQNILNEQTREYQRKHGSYIPVPSSEQRASPWGLLSLKPPHLSPPAVKAVLFLSTAPKVHGGSHGNVYTSYLLWRLAEISQQEKQLWPSM